MKRTCFYFFSILLTCLCNYYHAASQTTINTTVGSTGYLGNNNSGTGSFITFLIENNTGQGILLTDVGNWTTTAHNGTTSTLYFSSTSLSGPLPSNAVPAAGWTLVASGVVGGITTTGVNPVITGMSFLIPAGAIYRFALNTSGTNYYSLLGTNIPSPNSFTQNGITLRTGDYQIGGQNVGYGFSNNPRFFTGFATFIPATYFPPATGGGTFCAGENTSLTVTAPGKPNPVFFWKLPDGSYINSATINLNNLQPTNSGAYTAYAVYSPGVGQPLDTSGGTVVNVYVNAVPPKPIVAPVITYCQGESFDTIAIHGQNLKWYSVPVGGTFSPFPPQINTSTMGTATYYVSQTANNCESPRAAVTINVVPKPAPPIVTTPVRYCQGDVASPLEALGQNIRWYSVPTGGVGTPVTPTPGTNAQGNFTWYATQTAAGCESDRVPVEVSVSYKPNALITVSRPYVCQYDTITLNYFGNALITADYIWTLPTGATIVSGSGQGPLVVRFDSAGIKTVKLSVDNLGCVGPEARINIPVRLSPLFTLDMANDACKDEIVNIAVNYATTGIDTFNWNGFAGGEMVYGSLTAGPYGIRWNTPGVKVIEVQATDEICKSIPIFDTINIHELPDASFTVNTQNICAGDTVEFRGNYNPDNSYQWEPFQYFGASHSHIDTGIVDFTTFVKLTVTSKFNCRATDSVLINAKPCCEIYFPNAFTPNNDGKNDLFRPVTVGTHEISAFRVLNRWGQVIYESRNERGGWDGSYSGKPQDMGTYFYHVKYKCADGNFYEDKGEVTLVR